MKAYLLSLCSLLMSISAMGQQPNIIIILADDMALKSLHVDGGPNWLTTPSLDRIGDEGVRFRNSFVTYSLCEPSRAQLLTGYYPHITGIKTGGTTSEIPVSYYTLPEIMHDNGYYTGLVGKYQLGYVDTPRTGWDYWFSFEGGIDSPVNNGFFDTQCNVNGTDTFLLGHMTDLIDQYSLDYLNTMPDTTQPFFLLVSHAAAHRPFEPQPQFAGLYDSSYVALPSNYNTFECDYPSYLYPDNQYTNTDHHLKAIFRKYCELIKGIDVQTEHLFQWLTAHNKLSNTLLIFTADNGVFFAEHLLIDKSLQYDESIKVPLAVRYPTWFPVTGSTDSMHLALNLDLFSTVLDAAGVADTFNTHGISLNNLVNNTQQRDYFMYEYLEHGFNDIPDIRCVRSLNYKYVKSYCDSSTEEFFDLVTDPHENTNVINDTSYLSVINEYRTRLDSMRLALHDTATIPLGNCSLIQNCPTGVDENQDEDNSFEMDFNKWFVWFDGNYSNMNFIIKSSTGQRIEAGLYSMSGQLMKSIDYVNMSGSDKQRVDISKFSSGIYILKIMENKTPINIKFPVIH